MIAKSESCSSPQSPSEPASADKLCLGSNRRSNGSEQAQYPQAILRLLKRTMNPTNTRPPNKSRVERLLAANARRSFVRRNANVNGKKLPIGVKAELSDESKKVCQVIAETAQVLNSHRSRSSRSYSDRGDACRGAHSI